VYKTGLSANAPITPQVEQPQPVVTKFSDFRKYCTKTNMWSQLPAWQDFVQLAGSSLVEISSLHAFFVKLCVPQNNSMSADQGPCRPAELEWPVFCEIDKDWKFALETMGLTTARDLVSGVEIAGTTNPIKFCYDLFQRLYLINKDHHSQLDGEEFLNLICQQLQAWMIDGFQYRDAYDDATICEYHEAQMANLTKHWGFDSPYDLLAVISRAVVLDGSDEGERAAQMVTPLWPIIM